MSKQPSEDSAIPADAALIEAVAFLRMPEGGTVPSASATDELANSVLSRVQRATGLRPDATKVFSNMHALAVRAPQSFLDALSADDDVDKVQGNDLTESP